MKTYKIGRYELALPDSNQLPNCQQRYKMYDKALGDVANRLWERSPGFTAIDIGADVGDSAALICNKHDIRTLCIEGNPGCFPYLDENSRRMKTMQVCKKYVGFLPTNNLSVLLKDYPEFADFKLLKIDTEGSDYKIIHSNIEVIKRNLPVIFFEYIVKNGADKVSAAEAVSDLLALGYNYFTVYDNYGNMLINITGDHLARFAELSNYLVANHQHGIAIYYFDICAYPKQQIGENDATILQRLNIH